MPIRLIVATAVFLFYNICAGAFICSALTIPVSITDDGVYCLSHDRLLELGFTNPEAVGIYGFPAQMLNHNNFSGTCPTSPPAIPYIHTAGGNLLFFAQGPVTVSPIDPSHADISRNCYSTANTYFLSDESLSGHVSSSSGYVAFTSPPVSRHLSASLYEKELISPASTGNFFFGQEIRSDSPLDVSFDISNAVTDTPITLLHSYASKCYQNTRIGVSTPSGFSGRPIITSAKAASDSHQLYTFGQAKQTLSIDRFPPDNTLSVSLSVTSNPFWLRHDRSVCLFMRHNIIAHDAPWRVMHFTDHPDTFVLDCDGNLSSVWALAEDGSSCQLISQPIDNQIVYSLPKGYKKVVAWLIDRDYPEPRITPGQIDLNKNIIPDFLPDATIITTSYLLDKAQDYAAVHGRHSGLRLNVVTDSDIYNRYSSGTPHAMAIRLYARELYHKCKLAGKPLKAIILYGTGNWDNRGITRKLPGALITYQVEDQATAALTYANYCSDQYFGMLDEDFDFSSLLRQRMSVPVGRIPVRDTVTADEANRKLDCLLSSPPPRHVIDNLLVISDDGDGNSHLKQAEDIAMRLTLSRPYTITHRAHNLIFPWSGKIARKLQTFVSEKLTEGCGLLYIAAHGDHYNFGQEILWCDRLAASTCYDYPPFAFVASCSTYDFDRNPFSVGQAMFENIHGGVSALIATCRSVKMDYNHEISKAFVNALGHSIQGMTMGDIWMTARNAVASTAYDPDCIVNTLCYNYLGDPLLPVSTSSALISGVTIDGKSPDSTIALKALRTVNISGTVTAPDGVSPLDGTARIIITDAPRTVKTVIKDKDPAGKIEDITIDSDILVNLPVNVKEGRFSATFAPPESVNGVDGHRIIISFTADTKDIDGAVAIPGISILPPEGNTSSPTPDIMSLFIGTPGFREGDIVSSGAEVRYSINPGEAGLYTSNSGYGKGLVIRIDGKIMKNVATPVPDSGDLNVYNGSFTLPPLKDGMHTLSLSVRNNAYGYIARDLAFTICNDISLPKLLTSPDIITGDITVTAPINEIGSEIIALFDKAEWNLQIISPEGETVADVTSEQCPLPLTVDLRGKSVPGKHRVRLSVKPESTGKRLYFTSTEFIFFPLGSPTENNFQ